MATFIGDISKKDPAHVITNIETPMKGDHVVVTEGFYTCEFGEVSEVDAMTQTLTFFSESQQLRITVPIRMMAFNPNPAALRYTRERRYDLAAGDVIQVVRGEWLCVSGKVLCVNLYNSTLTFKDMPHTEVCFVSINFIHLHLMYMITVHHPHNMCCENWRERGS